MSKRDSPKHLVPLTPKTNRQRSKPSWIKCWQNWRKNRISIFSCQVFCSQFWHCLWTWSISGQNWSGKFNKFFFAPFKILCSHMTFGESLYPTIPKNKTSEGSSLSKQTKLILYYCEILSIKWTFSKSSYILIWMFWYMNYSSINCFIYWSKLKE